MAAALRAQDARRFALSHLLVGAVFAALKLSPAAAELWCAGGARLGLPLRVVCDRTDLVALPMLLVSYRVFGGRPRQARLREAWQRVTAGSGLLLGFIGVVATSRPPPRTPILGPRGVYMNSDRGLLERDRASGVAKRELDCRFRWQHVEAAGEFLVAEPWEGELSACDVVHGKMAWTRKMSGIEGARLLAAAPGHVLLGSDEHLWMLDPATGYTSWDLPLANRGAALLDDDLYVRGLDDRVERYRASNGKRGAAAFIAQTALAFAPLWQSQGVILAQGDQGAVESWNTWFGLDAIDAGSGGLLWQLPAPSAVVARSDDVLFTRSSPWCHVGALLTAREARSGQQLWSIPFCRDSDSVAADRDLVLTATVDKNGPLAAVRDVRGGHVRWFVRYDR